MWGTLAKIGGSILAGLGIDWAYETVKENQTAKLEQAQMDKQAKWGKYILIATVIFVGYYAMGKKK